MLNYLYALLFERAVLGRDGATGKSRSRSTSRKKPGCRPALEVLDGRTVPSGMGTDKSAAMLHTGGVGQWQQQLTSLIQTETQLTTLAGQANGGSLLAREVATLVRADQQRYTRHAVASGGKRNFRGRCAYIGSHA